MRTNIIEDLRSYYVDQNVKIHRLLNNKKIASICDAYFKDHLSYRTISELYNIKIPLVRKIIITASGLIIRNRHRIGYYA